jgi:hypothetical protein
MAGAGFSAVVNRVLMATAVHASVFIQIFAMPKVTEKKRIPGNCDIEKTGILVETP